jgi:hypothetical protein
MQQEAEGEFTKTNFEQYIGGTLFSIPVSHYLSSIVRKQDKSFFWLDYKMLDENTFEAVDREGNRTTYHRKNE